MTEARIRRQVYELTADDLRAHPAWEFCLDEEGEPDQDEATVRPIARGPLGFGVVAAAFRTADGREFAGYVTPASDEDQATLQPTLVTDGGQVAFWLGWVDRDRAAASRRDAYERLGTTAQRLFPISYRAAGGWSTVPLEGSIHGFGRLEKQFLRGLRTVVER